MGGFSWRFSVIQASFERIVKAVERQKLATPVIVCPLALLGFCFPYYQLCSFILSTLPAHPEYFFAHFPPMCNTRRDNDSCNIRIVVRYIRVGYDHYRYEISPFSSSNTHNPLSHRPFHNCSMKIADAHLTVLYPLHRGYIFERSNLPDRKTGFNWKLVCWWYWQPMLTFLFKTVNLLKLKTKNKKIGILKLFFFEQWLNIDLSVDQKKKKKNMWICEDVKIKI